MPTSFTFHAPDGDVMTFTGDNQIDAVAQGEMWLQAKFENRVRSARPTDLVEARRRTKRPRHDRGDGRNRRSE